MSRANLIAQYNLSNRQLDIIGKRLMQWNPNNWWLMTIKEPPKSKALESSNQTKIWHIPIQHHPHSIHKVLNKRWRILRDWIQWSYHLSTLCGYIEPKKSCLAWFIMYIAIWTQMKARHIGKGDGKCARCGQEEGNIHILLQCKAIFP